jgi:hypothetical protein
LDIVPGHEGDEHGAKNHAEHQPLGQAETEANLRWRNRNFSFLESKHRDIRIWCESADGKPEPAASDGATETAPHHCRKSLGEGHGAGAHLLENVCDEFDPD